MFKYLLFCLILSVFLPFSVHAQSYHVVKDFRHEWQNHEPNLKVLVPYLSTSPTQSISFDLPLNQYAHSMLLIVCPEKYSVYIDQALVEVTSKADSLIYSIDSLRGLYPNGVVNVQLYSRRWNGARVETKIISEGSGRFLIDSRTDAPNPRASSNDDMMILGSLLVFAVMVVFRTQVYRLFKEYFTLIKTFRVRQKFDLITAQDPISPVSIGFMLMYALFIGAAVVNFSIKMPLMGVEVWLPWLSDESSEVVWGLYATGLAFVAMFLKIPLVNIVSGIFNLRRYAELHFYAYFRMSLLISFLVFIMSLILFISGDIYQDLLTMVFRWMLLAVLAIRLVMMYLILNNAFNVKKMHLISYLCSSEFIPLIMFIKTLFR